MHIGKIRLVVITTLFHWVLLTTLLCPVKAAAQSPKTNLRLKAQLDSIGRVDQQYRLLVDNLTATVTDSLARSFGIPKDSVYESLMARQALLDATNITAIAQIIKQFGYPGKSLVGTPKNEVAFYVIQHSTRIREYLPMLQRAARKGELDRLLVAMMEDRYLADAQKEQIYGTQLWGNAAKDSVTGVVKPHFYFNPIRDPKNVNKRRRKAGFTTTIEQYAAEMNVPYEIKRPWWWK